MITLSPTHTHTYTHSVGLLWVKDRPVSTIHNDDNRPTSMLPAGFQSAIPASQRPQTLALYHATTGIGPVLSMKRFWEYSQLASNTVPAACRFLHRLCLFPFRRYCERSTAFEPNRRQTGSRLCSQNHMTLTAPFSRQTSIQSSVTITSVKVTCSHCFASSFDNLCTGP